MRTWYSYLFFFLMMTSVLGGVHYYLWHRLVRVAVLPAGWHSAFSILVWTGLVLILVSFPLFRVIPLSWQTPLMYVAFTWMGVMFLLFVLLVVRDFGLAVSFWAQKETLDPDRRLFLTRATALGVGALAGGATALSVRQALRALHVKEVPVALNGLTGKLSGLKIVQVSDIHVGPTIGRDFIAEMVEKINALEPDIVAITGDLVDGSVATLAPHVAPLAGIKSKLGTYFVPGNHEFYSGLEDWLTHLGTLGIRVLRNERVTLNYGGVAFDLVGLDDETGGPDMDAAVAGRDTNLPLFVLAHQPRTIKKVDQHGALLQLSGHTHAGQIWPFNYLVYLAQPYLGGLYKHKDMHIYVSPGTGYWGPPMRLGTQAEITKIILT